MHKLAGIIISFFVLSVIFSVLETLFAADKAQKRFREGFKTDLVYWFFTPLVTETVTSAAMAIMFSLLFHIRIQELKAAFADRHTWLTDNLPLWAQIPLLLLVADLVSYWSHRWFHGRALWKFHAVHHCSEKLDWLSSVRLHPVNDIVSKMLMALALLGLGFNPKVVAGLIPVFTFYAIMIHANVTWDLGSLGQLITSPRFHRWHHTSQKEGLDKNFAGMFPWLDRIFGTYYMPKDKLPEKFGLYGEKIPESFWGQMVYPFRKKRAE